MQYEAFRFLFDAEWYLEQNSDVNAAGVDPWEHFCKFGHAEGRQPAYSQALDYERDFWFSDAHDAAEFKLRSLINSSQLNYERWLARWALARWYGSLGKWEYASKYLSELPEPEHSFWLFIQPSAPQLLYLQILLETRQWDSAYEYLNEASEISVWDALFAELAIAAGSDQKVVVSDEVITRLTNTYQGAGLTGFLLNEDRGFNGLSSRGRDNSIVDRFKLQVQRRTQSLVSVIIPCFNAQDTIAQAIASIEQQTWQAIEIIVVDDASTDESLRVVEAIASQNRNIKIIPQTDNSGAYNARNVGVAASSGSYVTVLDADDWAHPQKIAQQVKAIEKSRHAKASISYHIRLTNELQPWNWRTENSWIKRNVSSLMFTREVFKKLGFWDCVKMAGDTEYLERIQAVYGTAAIEDVHPGIPLGLSRASSGALTQASQTSLRTHFFGPRAEYHKCSKRWHSQSSDLFLEQTPAVRPFPIPPFMCTGNEQQQDSNLKLNAKMSPYFDERWYLRNNPDVAQAKQNAFEHYWRFGRFEGREPGPLMSTSAVSRAFPKLKASEALAIYQGLLPIVEKGERAVHEERPQIIAVGHQVSDYLFGAERSFLDTLEMLSSSFDVHVILPSAKSATYVDEIRQFACQVMFVPMVWWRSNRTPEISCIQALESFFSETRAKLIYVNTIVLWEPFIAAKNLNIPSLMHARELPEHDPELCRALAASPDTIREHIHTNVDFFIANSELVYRYLQGYPEGIVLPNAVPEQLMELPVSELKAPLRVGMVSSNLLKKGIQDFFSIAKAFSENPNIQFHLFGPKTEELTQLLEANSGLGNIAIHGYVDDPKFAFKEIDVLLNLSHFAESFGRTVLEAMAAGRLAICYEWGALSDLISNERGILVKRQDPQAVISALKDVLNAPHLYSPRIIESRNFSNQYAASEMEAKLQRFIKRIIG
ncbi:MAG: family 2 glycosyl transferase [Idiomarinaceae bacterium HL-53]|nr:MAG: family 2 glycosyl transferase [Idiomarinaceae bacterium HL-53]CUS47077.1 Glycosyl transferases group 1 [Idiomarinaceae bacterium HL-53]CUS49599.1 Glycosyl transferases group 1 [Idiomarinaceae bacterium HL-53]